MHVLHERPVLQSRAEYGLLYWLMREIQEDPDLELQIIATGMHLSPEFGLTYREIEKDGFTIDKKVEMLLSSDTPVGVSKSMGLGMIDKENGVFGTENWGLFEYKKRLSWELLDK